MIAKLLDLVDTYWPDITQQMRVLMDMPSTLSEHLQQSVFFLLSKVSLTVTSPPD